MLNIFKGVGTLLVGIWLVVHLAGKYQYKRVRNFTLDLVDSETCHIKGGRVSVEEFYAYLLPKWEEFVSDKVLFILHKTELWPIPAQVDTVRQRLNFTPAWLGAYLKLNEVKISIEKPQLEEKINQIIKTATPREE